MTAGERSGRDYGHDDPTWPAPEAGPVDDPGSRQAGGAWTEPSPWPASGHVPHQPGAWPERTSPEHDPWSERDSWAERDPWSQGAGVYQSGYPDRDPAGHHPISDGDSGRQPVPAAAPGHGSAGRGGHGYLPSPRGSGRLSWLGRAGRPQRRGMPLWQELPLLLVIAFCLAILVRTFLLQAFYIPSGSMEDTLIAGDRVLVNKVVYQFRGPARGEVVVFQGTDAWAPISGGDEDIGSLSKVGRALGDLVGVSRPGAKDYIKRVIGLPGDTVSCCDVDGRVFVNGQPLDEPYVIRNSPLDDVPVGDCRSRRFDEVVVQPGQMFVMGDHRQVSQDSRCQGQVPIENVIGRAFVIVWPSDRWGALSRPEPFVATAQPATTPVDPSGAGLAFTLPLILSLCPHSRIVRRVAGFPR